MKYLNINAAELLFHRERQFFLVDVLMYPQSTYSPYGYYVINKHPFR